MKIKIKDDFDYVYVVDTDEIDIMYENLSNEEPQTTIKTKSGNEIYPFCHIEEVIKGIKETEREQFGRKRCNTSKSC